MPVPLERQICVIVAAFNASATIGRAVKSALVQPQVGEVIVVHDELDVAGDFDDADEAGMAGV